MLCKGALNMDPLYMVSNKTVHSLQEKDNKWSVTYIIYVFVWAQECCIGKKSCLGSEQYCERKKRLWSDYTV